MRIVLTGATGTIGRAVVSRLTARGDRVVALGRDEARARRALGPDVEVFAWSAPTTTPPPAAALRGADGIINLLGEPVAQRWSEEAKRAIRDSRVEATRLLVEGVRALDAHERPRVLVSQSASGYYGPGDDRPLDESAPPGHDFLAEVTVAWEGAALSAQPDVRVAVTRTGVVLSPSGGALARMLPFYRLGLGGPIAGGRQYVPWIHLDDVVAGLLHCLDTDAVRGPVNLAAPNSVTNAELSRALGRVLRRPAMIPVPAFGLRVLYGEMAEIVVTGQRVVPRALETSGYTFRHVKVEPALRDVLAAG